ncbi:WxcM-like domain-containing protein [Treponema pedis]|uniref:WxcM-like domain-containing protein n=1 Tax=Treponema pedis TaxID=409322 RepID=UPI003D1B58F6
MLEITLPKITDGRGNLSFLESYSHIPFEIQGVHLLNIFDTNDIYIFNDNGDTKFCFIALSGSFLLGNDDVDNKDDVGYFFLGVANKAVVIDEKTNFALFKFSENTVVLILSSTRNINFIKRA